MASHDKGGRPPSQGDNALAIDAQRISQILRRVMLDPYRTDKQKKEIADCLKKAMSLILMRSTSKLAASKAG